MLLVFPSPKFQKKVWALVELLVNVKLSPLQTELLDKAKLEVGVFTVSIESVTELVQPKFDVAFNVTPYLPLVV